MNSLKGAIALVTVCNRLRIGNGTRARWLQEAEGIEGIPDYLESCDEAPAGLLDHLKEEAARQESRSYPKSWRALSLADSDYPERLRHISLPPAILFVSGLNWVVTASPFVIAVIGSRRPSAYGIEVTRKLTAAIAVRGVPVVSGGARGIDALAHRTSLQKGGPTFAVLGNGLGVTYPPEHKTLFGDIEKKGALITEFPPGTPPKRNHFPARNRILAGLCDAVLVTEASSASGTLITAGFAGDYGRDVLAVPGSILSGRSRSCHNLIKDGAVLVEGVKDIPGLPDLAWPDIDSELRREKGFEFPSRRLSSEDSGILEVLSNAPRTITDLAGLCGLERSDLLIRLASLTQKGLVRLDRGLYTFQRGNQQVFF